MIWMLIIIGIVAVSGFFVWLGSRESLDGLATISVLVCSISSVILMISGITIADEHIGQDKEIAKLQAERDAIVYQYEEGMYLGDALGEFNGKVAAGQTAHENPWTSWFYGDYWMQIEQIPLK